MRNWDQQWIQMCLLLLSYHPPKDQMLLEILQADISMSRRLWVSSTASSRVSAVAILSIRDGEDSQTRPGTDLSTRLARSRHRTSIRIEHGKVLDVHLTSSLAMLISLCKKGPHRFEELLLPTTSSLLERSNVTVLLPQRLSA